MEEESVVDSPVGVEDLALLVEVDDFEAGPQAYRAGARGQFTQQQPQQGGLAGAVGADHAHAVAAQDRAVQVVDQDLVTVGEGHTLGACHQSAAAPGVLQFQIRRRGALSPGPPLLAHD